MTTDRVEPDASELHLTLFVSGTSELSRTAIGHATSICDEHLAGRYLLTVVDVHQNPAAVHASGVAVQATPTLVKTRPQPARKCVGDLSSTPAVLAALGVLPAGAGR